MNESLLKIRIVVFAYEIVNAGLAFKDSRQDSAFRGKGWAYKV